MKFVFPEFLFALFALAIPIIIHLFSFRRFKKVYFTNVRFLKEIKQETQSQSKLKHLLILVARILAISFLVFAFAQPYLPLENKKIILGNNAVSIFVDNSFSMDAINKNGALLDEAKKRAEEIVNVYQYSDQFQLLTNDFEGKHQRLVSKEEFTEMLTEIKISPSVRTFKEIISRQFDLLNSSDYKSKSAYIVSDFQKDAYNMDEIKNDTAVSVMIIPVSAQQRNNVYIDSCWFSSPVQQLNQAQQLNVRIINKSENKIENNPVKLFINGQQKAIASFNAEVNDPVVVLLSFNTKEAGIQHGKIEISDYPVTFDDQFYFSFNVAKQISILAINSSEKKPPNNESPYLNSLFGKDSLFVFKNSSEDKLDYSNFSNYQFIILNEIKNISSGLSQELKRFVSNGGSAMVFPAKGIDFSSYKDFLSALKCNYYESLDTTNTRVDKINYEHELLSDVFNKDKEQKSKYITSIDLPVVQNHYRIMRTTHSNEEYILKLLNGDVFLSKYNFGKGKLYLSSVPLNDDFSNFQKHALFVPVLFKIAMYSQPSQKFFYTIGKDDIFETTNTNVTGENVFHVKNINNSFDIIPEHKVIDNETDIFVHDQIKQSGNYNLIESDQPIAGLAFNYDRKESDLSCFTAEELSQQIDSKGWSNFKVVTAESKSLTQTLAELNQGKKLWKLCIILALVFLGIEVLLLRYWK